MTENNELIVYKVGAGRCGSSVFGETLGMLPNA